MQSGKAKSYISKYFVIAVKKLKTDGRIASQNRFLSDYGYSKSLISHIEKGRQDVTLNFLYRVINDFRLNPAYFFGISEELYR